MVPDYWKSLLFWLLAGWLKPAVRLRTAGSSGALLDVQLLIGDKWNVNHSTRPSEASVRRETVTEQRMSPECFFLAVLFFVENLSPQEFDSRSERTAITVAIATG